MSKQPNWHNPQKVSTSKRGIGWRFLTTQENNHLRSVRMNPDWEPYAPVQMWSEILHCWSNSKWTGGDIGATYRTRKPLGYFLPKKPKPKRKVEFPMDAFERAAKEYDGGPDSIHIFNAGRRYERRRLKAGGAT